MNKKFTISIFLFLFLISNVIIFTNAIWVLDDFTVGQWQYKYDYEWKSKDNNNNAKFVYVNNRTNFQEWSFGVSLDEFALYGVWFWSHIYQVFNATFYDENGITTYQVIVQIRVMLPNEYQTYIMLYENGTLQNSIQAIALGYSHVAIWKNTTNWLFIDTIYKESKTTNGSYVIRHYEKNIGSSFFTNIQMIQTVKKTVYNGASGFIKGTKHDEILTSGAGLDYTPHSETEMSLGDKILWSIWHDLSLAGKVIYDLLPDAIKSIWDITFSVLLTMIQFLLGTLAPNILTYFAIYVIMLAISCFLTATEIIGEEYEFGAGKEQPVIERVKNAFQPLFDLFIKMFEISMKVLEFIIGIIFGR